MNIDIITEVPDTIPLHEVFDQIRDQVMELETREQQAKDNYEFASDSCRKWSDMYDAVNDRKAEAEKKYNDLHEKHYRLQENAKLIPILATVFVISAAFNIGQFVFAVAG